MSRELLKAYQGRFVRLGPANRSEPTLAGILVRVTDQYIHIRRLVATEERLIGPFRVEILASDALIRFFANGETDWIHAEEILLEFPDRVDVVERRGNVDQQRKQVALPVWIKPVNESRTPAEFRYGRPSDPPHGQTLDVGPLGVALTTEQCLTANQAVTLTIGSRMSPCTLEVAARVVRFGPGPVGSWFAALHFEQAGPEIGVFLDILIKTEQIAAFGLQRWPAE